MAIAMYVYGSNEQRRGWDFERRHRYFIMILKNHLEEKKQDKVLECQCNGVYGSNEQRRIWGL